MRGEQAYREGKPNLRLRETRVGVATCYTSIFYDQRFKLLSLRLRYTRAISRAYSTIYACKNFLAKNKIHRADFGQVKHTEVDSDAK